MNKNPNSTRSGVIIKSGRLFVLVNFLLAVFNVIVGIISGSLAITSDAAHSLIDAVSGFIIIIAERLANHHKLADFRAKIERITTIIIALIIMAVGVHIIMESIEKFIEPETPDYTAPVIIVLIASIIAKYLLAAYLKRQGQKYHSDVLAASSVETMNDTWISVAVLISATIYLIWHIDIEAYISIIIAIVILKIGLEFIFPKISHHHHHPLDTDPTHGA